MVYGSLIPICCLTHSMSLLLMVLVVHPRVYSLFLPSHRRRIAFRIRGLSIRIRWEGDCCVDYFLFHELLVFVSLCLFLRHRSADVVRGLISTDCSISRAVRCDWISWIVPAKQNKELVVRWPDKWDSHMRVCVWVLRAVGTNWWVASVSVLSAWNPYW